MPLLYGTGVPALDCVGILHLSRGKRLSTVCCVKAEKHPCRCRMSAPVGCITIQKPSEVLSCPRDWSMTKGCHPVLWSGECPAISLWPFIQTRSHTLPRDPACSSCAGPPMGLLKWVTVECQRRGLNFFNFLKTVQKPFINWFSNHSN